MDWHKAKKVCDPSSKHVWNSMSKDKNQFYSETMKI